MLLAGALLCPLIPWAACTAMPQTVAGGADQARPGVAAAMGAATPRDATTSDASAPLGQSGTGLIAAPKQARSLPLPASFTEGRSQAHLSPSCLGCSASGERQQPQCHLWAPGGVLRGPVGRGLQRRVWCVGGHGRMQAGELIGLSPAGGGCLGKAAALQAMLADTP